MSKWTDAARRHVVDRALLGAHRRRVHAHVRPAAPGLDHAAAQAGHLPDHPRTAHARRVQRGLPRVHPGVCQEPYRFLDDAWVRGHADTPLADELYRIDQRGSVLEGRGAGVTRAEMDEIRGQAGGLPRCSSRTSSGTRRCATATRPRCRTGNARCRSSSSSSAPPGWATRCSGSACAPATGSPRCCPTASRSCWPTSRCRAPGCTASASTPATPRRTTRSRSTDSGARASITDGLTLPGVEFAPVPQRRRPAVADRPRRALRRADGPEGGLPPRVHRRHHRPVQGRAAHPADAAGAGEQLPPGARAGDRARRRHAARRARLARQRLLLPAAPGARGDERAAAAFPRQASSWSGWSAPARSARSWSRR